MISVQFAHELFADTAEALLCAKEKIIALDVDYFVPGEPERVADRQKQVKTDAQRLKIDAAKVPSRALPDSRNGEFMIRVYGPVKKARRARGNWDLLRICKECACTHTMHGVTFLIPELPPDPVHLIKRPRPSALKPPSAEKIRKRHEFIERVNAEMKEEMRLWREKYPNGRPPTSAS